MYKAKITESSELDDNLKQSVVVVLLDPNGNKVNNVTSEFYGFPDEIRTKVINWKQKMIDKIDAASTVVKKGDLF